MVCNKEVENEYKTQYWLLPASYSTNNNQCHNIVNVVASEGCLQWGGHGPGGLLPTGEDVVGGVDGQYRDIL